MGETIAMGASSKTAREMLKNGVKDAWRSCIPPVMTESHRLNMGTSMRGGFCRPVRHIVKLGYAAYQADCCGSRDH
jgi:hypothetical protein